jgi:hypothetical protein
MNFVPNSKPFALWDLLLQTPYNAFLAKAMQSTSHV